MKIKALFLICSLQTISQFCAEPWSNKHTEMLAAIKDPIVDLFTRLPLPVTSPASSSDRVFRHNCHRAHQGLFNEIVHINKIVGNLVQISYDYLIYGVEKQSGKPLSHFWTTTNHLIFLKDLTSEEQDTFPCYDRQSSTVIVLTRPWHGYSLGTRFTLEEHHNVYDSNTYTVKYFDHTKQCINTYSIPATHARLEAPLTKGQARNLFVHLAYEIIGDATAKHGVIPYVWGGSSYQNVYSDIFELHPTFGWDRPHAEQPYAGFDCSELVFRFAQTCSIPYQWKNACMARNHLQEIMPQEPLEDGDIIASSDHIMIISSVKKNEIIEARGYDSGFGKVHCIKLSECFREIETYDQLREAAQKHRPLTFLQKDGSAGNHFIDYKLLKLL